MEKLITDLETVFREPAARIALILGGTLIAMLLARLVVFRVVTALSRKTETAWDDQAVKILRNPVVLSILLAGVWLITRDLGPAPPLLFMINGAIKTMAVLLWSIAAMRLGSLVLEVLSVQAERAVWLQNKTLPLFEIMLKTLVVGGSIYFLLLAWEINVTTWVASAGVAGIAIGFAAKDTLANLFAGVFIVADQPYAVGDFVNLDNSTRGMVTDIGLRSTRILTRDDIEATLPNAVIANAMIINETSGPHEKMRVRVQVAVAYGSDLDQVRELLLQCANGVEHIAADPAPRVRFRSFGASGLEHELLAWIEKPVYRGRVLDALNRKVYQALGEAGLEIPYAKQDVYIKEFPGR